MTEHEKIDLTPDNSGLIRWLREVAKTDRTMAMNMLVNGWPMSVAQAKEILDGDPGMAEEIDYDPMVDLIHAGMEAAE